MQPSIPIPDYSKQTAEPTDLLKQRTNYNFVFLTIATLAAVTLANSLYLLAASVVAAPLAYASVASAVVVAPYAVYARWRMQVSPTVPQHP